MFRSISRRFISIIKCKRHLHTNNTKFNNCSVCWDCSKPYQLICFKQWNIDMVYEIVLSALKMKALYYNTHGTKVNFLHGTKIMILEEVNEPFLSMAVSKAAAFLGADCNSVIDKLSWEQDYNGTIFSLYSDAIFVITKTHQCLQRFADCSSVPVMCLRSRAHSTIQSLATVMTILEEYGTMQFVNIAYLGKAHPILNSLLLLCPTLGANINYRCSCKKMKVSPLLQNASQNMCEESNTIAFACDTKKEALTAAWVIQAGPASTNPEFKISLNEICANACCNWIFMHTCPRGPEVADELFYHPRSRTFNVFNNMQYICAALMFRAVKGFAF